MSEGAAVLASSHTSVLINHCSAQLRMHTRATTSLGRVLLVGEGLETADCGIGTASNETRATWHTGPRLQVHTHTGHTHQVRKRNSTRLRVGVVACTAQSRGPQQKTLNKRGVCLVPGRFGLANGAREGLATTVALCSCCYCCLGYRSQVFFVAISTS